MDGSSSRAIASAPMNRWASLLFSAAVVTGCTRPRTEIVARVDSELAWGPSQRVQSVQVEVRRNNEDGEVRSRRVSVLGTGEGRVSLPLIVGVLPNPDNDPDSPGAVWIEALGCPDSDGCTRADALVAQRAIVAFMPETTLDLRLLLAARCEDPLLASRAALLEHRRLVMQVRGHHLPESECHVQKQRHAMCRRGYQ